MNLESYLIQKQRNKVKKKIRLLHPTLFGQRLEAEVDKVFGVVQSGKMDWATLVDIVHKTEESKYPTPESITPDDLQGVATEYKTRPYLLYWFYTQKLEKLQAGGRKKYDYMAVLKGCVPHSLKKTLTDPEKKSAAVRFAKFSGATLTDAQVDTMIFSGQL